MEETKEGNFNEEEEQDVEDHKDVEYAHLEVVHHDHDVHHEHAEFHDIPGEYDYGAEHVHDHAERTAVDYEHNDQHSTTTHHPPLTTTATLRSSMSCGKMTEEKSTLSQEMSIITATTTK